MLKSFLLALFVVVSIMGVIGLLISWLSQLVRSQEPITRMNSVPVLKHDEDEEEENEKEKAEG